MTVSELLFSLIRSEICPNKETNLPETVLQDDLNSMLILAKNHDVSYIASKAVQRCGLMSSDKLSERFLNEQLISAYRCEQFKYALDEICSVFEKEKIPYILLKGSVLRSYYPEEFMRTSCDIDILVHDEDMKRAVNALVTTIDYKTDGKRHYHDMSLYSPTGIHLELHFNIKENMDGIDSLLSNVWDYSILKDGFRYELTNEFFVFHHIAHMSYHFVHGGCGIRPFVDLLVMKNNMGYDDSVVGEYCRRCGIETFYRNVLDLVNAWFENGEHTSLTCKIEDYILQGGVFGTLENRVLVAQSKSGGKVGYVFSRLFMPYDALKDYFPILKKHKWLLPFMQVRRWIRFFINGSFKRGVGEMKINQSVNKYQVESMSDFLKEVGL